MMLRPARRGRDGREFDPEPAFGVGGGHPREPVTLEARAPIADLTSALGDDVHPRAGDRLTLRIDDAADDGSTPLGPSLDYLRSLDAADKGSARLDPRLAFA